jgi:hypothetical protein
MNEHVSPETLLSQPVCWRLYPKLMSPALWEMVRPTLDKAEADSDGDYTKQGLIDQFFEGKVQFWIIWDKTRKKSPDDKPSIIIPQHLATFITRVQTNEAGRRTLWCDLINGRDYKSWSRVFIEQLRLYGRETGCEDVQALTREGFVKTWQKYGCKVMKVLMQVSV